MLEFVDADAAADRRQAPGPGRPGLTRAISSLARTDAPAVMVCEMGLDIFMSQVPSLLQHFS
jgi:hypothetical protein